MGNGTSRSWADRSSTRRVAMNRATRCTVSSEMHGDCGREVPDGMPSSVCFKHAMGVFTFMQGAIDDAPAELKASFITPVIRSERETLNVPDVTGGAVYYLLMDGLIKIGHTVDLRRRMMSYPPNAKYLAHELGTTATERMRHRQFGAYLKMGREWFIDCEAIRHHIAGIEGRELHPVQLGLFPKSA